MKPTSIKLVTRICIIAVAFCAAASSLLSIAPKVHAAEPVNFDTRAKSVQIYNAILTSCKMSTKMADDDAQNYEWFQSKNGIYPGSFVGAPEAGDIKCYDKGPGSAPSLTVALKEMWSSWGLEGTSYDQVLKSIGYNQESNGFWYPPNNGDIDAAKNNFLNYIKSKQPDFFITDDALLYFIWHDAFINQCGASERTGADDISKADKAVDHYAKIQYAKTDGSVAIKYYYLTKSFDDLANIGFNLSANAGSRANCGEVAKKLFDNKQWATAYAAAIKAGKAKELTGGTGSDVVKQDSTCYSNIASFGWILCPIIDVADGVYGFMRSSVYSLLAMPELTSGSQSGLQASWAAVRNIANTLLVLVALFMIASQVFNFSFVDAYTVKKVLPRLVIAAILIQLSWFLFTTMIELFNALGYGLNTLVTAPFQASSGGDIVDIVGTQTGGDKAEATLFTIFGTAIGLGSLGLLAISPGGMLTIALVCIGVVISVIMALLTLIIRKLLLLVLLIIAPIALVAWILPNTQKFWNAWWQLFTKLLIMFPLIALLFAAGQIGANVIASSQSKSNTFGQGGLTIILAIIAYFAPLFLIPATFKFAGGIFGTIVGGINNVGGRAKKNGFGLRARKEAYDKLKNEQRAQIVQRGARENMAKTLSGSGSGFNRLRGRAALGVSGFLPGGRGTRNLERATQQYKDYDDKINMDDAAAQYRGLTSYASHKQKKDLEDLLLSKKTGERFDYEVQNPDGSTTTRTIEATEYMQRQALNSASINKNEPAITQFALASTSDPRKAAALEAFKSKDGGFGGIDEVAPDIARGKPENYGDVTTPEAFATALKNFRTLKGDRKQQVIDHINRLATAVDSNGAIDIDSRRQAATIINAFARREDIGLMEPEDLVAFGNIGGGVAREVIESGGNLRGDIDVSGNLVTVGSSQTTGTPPSPNGGSSSQIPGQGELF